MNQDLVIGIRSTLVNPYPERHQECLDTWGREFQNKGYNVKVLLGDPNLTPPYKEDSNILWSSSPDDHDNVFFKAVYYPYQWFLNETDYKYFFITDNDTFIHCDKFISRLEYIIDKYKEVDFWGCELPWWGGQFSIVRDQALTDYHQASGGSGWLVSRKAAQIVIKQGLDHIKNLDTYWYDDLITSQILKKNSIELISDSTLLFDSPFKKSIHVLEGAEPCPYIGNESGNHLIAQHYVNGKMKDIMNYIKNKQNA